MKLGDAKYKVRQKASKDLTALVEKDPSLASELRTIWAASTDPEVRLRLNKVLRALPIKEWRFNKAALTNEVWELDQEGRPTFEFLDENTIRIDATRTPADFLRIRLRNPATNAVHKMVFSFELKVEEQKEEHATISGVMANMENDRHQAFAFFWEQRVASIIQRQSHNHDFSKGFVPVRMETSGNSYRVYVDGKKIIETPFGNYHNPDGARSWAVFGDSTRGSSGRSVWRNVRFQLFER